MICNYFMIKITPSIFLNSSIKMIVLDISFAIICSKRNRSFGYPNISLSTRTGMYINFPLSFITEINPCIPKIILDNISSNLKRAVTTTATAQQLIIQLLITHLVNYPTMSSDSLPSVASSNSFSNKSLSTFTITSF